MLAIERDTHTYTLDSVLDMDVGVTTQGSGRDSSFVSNTLRAALSAMVKRDLGAPDNAVAEISIVDGEIAVEVAWIERG